MTAGHFDSFPLEAVEINREGHIRREETGDRHHTEEAAVSDSRRPVPGAALHDIRSDGIGSEAEGGLPVRPAKMRSRSTESAVSISGAA